MIDTVLLSYFTLAFTSLITLINPIGITPVFLSLVEPYNNRERIKIAFKGVVTATIILLIFLGFGRLIFSFFGITIYAFKIAGGILFFRNGINMLESKISRTKSTPKEEKEASETDEIAITPIGMPLIAGPGAITSIMILASDANTTEHRLLLFFTVIIVMVLTFTIFYTADILTQKFGTTGLRIIQRIMGFILMVIAVQFIINGLTPIVTGWFQTI